MQTEIPQQEQIVLEPTEQLIFDRLEAYVSDADYWTDPDDEDGEFESRSERTVFEDGSSIFVNQYKQNPDVLASISFQQPNAPELEIDFTVNGQLIPGESNAYPFETVDEISDLVLQKLKEARELDQFNKEHERAIKADVEVANFGRLEELDEETARRIIQSASLSKKARKEIALPELTPSAKQRLADNMTAYYCNPIRDDRGRLAVLGYVERGENVTPNMYYLSLSQGVWRYLPRFDMDTGHFSKGASEFSLTLPVPMQKALSEMSADSIDPEDRYEVIAFASPEEEPEDMEYLDKTRLVDYKDLNDLTSRFVSAPETVSLDDDHKEFAPDFTATRKSWTQQRPAYAGGAINIEIVPSTDGLVEYMYMRDQDGRVWLGGADDITSPIRDCGIRQSWIDLGVAATPGIEYDRQAGNYAGEHIRNKYVDVYKTYLSKVPLIKDYVEYPEESK